MATRKEKRESEKDSNYFFEFVRIQKHFFKHLINHFGKLRDHRSQSYITYGPETILFTVLLKNMAGLSSMRSMSAGFNKEECIENIRKVLHVDRLEELPHYDHCLRRDYTDKETGETKTIYMHHVLEAKLVVSDMVFSIGSEFIENESEDVTKQDCEIKAFYRLAKKIKQTYKRLPICLLGDSLYACEPVFQLCEENKWPYIIRFKEGRIKSIATEFQTLKNMEQRKANESVFWVNEIPYNKRTVNLVELQVETKDGKRKHFVFITSFSMTPRNAERLLAAGRSRWKIENQGFNYQKTIHYHIEHANSHDYTAMKNHYLITQIADIIMQLGKKGIPLLKRFKKTAKEISSTLLEAIRTRRLTDEDIAVMVKPIQVRFT